MTDYYLNLVKSYIKICANLPQNVADLITEYLENYVEFKTNSLNELHKHKTLYGIKLYHVISDGKKKVISIKLKFDNKKKCRYRISEDNDIALVKDKYLRYLIANMNFVDNLYIYIDVCSNNIKKFMMPYFKKKYKQFKKNTKRYKIRKGFKYRSLPEFNPNIGQMNKSYTLLCNRINKLFPTPIIKLIVSFINFPLDHDYDLYENSINRFRFVKDVNIEIKKKKLTNIFVTFTNHKCDLTEIVKLTSSTTFATIHNQKYMLLFIKSMIMSHDYRSRDGLNEKKLLYFYLGDYSPTMEKFIYDILKRDFVPKYKVYKKAFGF